MARLSLSLLISLSVVSLGLAQETTVDKPLAVALDKTAKEADRLTALMTLADLGLKAAEAAPALVTVLEEKNESLRLNTALALGKMGQKAVAPLVKALDHAEPDVRFYAVWSLGWIGPEAKGAAGKVIALLADPNDGVRRKAAYTLGRIAPEPKTAIAELFKALNDKNPDVRQAVSEALTAFGKDVIPTLRQRLAEGQPVDIRRWCLGLCEKLGPQAKEAMPEVRQIFLNAEDLKTEAGAALSKMGKDALPVLREGLKSEKNSVRLESLAAMGRMGADAATDLVDALGHANADVRRTAAQMLSPLRIADKMVVLGLAHVLQDDDPPTRNAALQALANLGPQAHWALPKLLAMLAKEPNAPQRELGMRLLTVARGEPKDVMPVLTQLFTGDQRAKTQALRAAQLYGPDGLPLLLAALKDADGTVRQQALFTLNTIPGDLSKNLDDVKPLLKDPQLFVRRGAVAVLGRMGEAALPDLIVLLKDKDNLIRSSAAGSLKQIGPSAKKALADLATLAAKDQDQNVRRNCVLALAALGQDGLDPLLRCLKDEKIFTVRLALVNSMAAYGPEAKAAVPALIDVLGEKVPVLRSSAAAALGAIGPDAQAAIPALERSAMDTNITVRNSATAALARIRDKK